MKNYFLLLICSVSLLIISISSLKAAPIERLSVSENNRFLMTESGKPFFPIADTAWKLAVKLNRADVLSYLQIRKDQKFNTIALVAFPMDGVAANVYGDQPFVIVGGKYDPLQPVTTPGNDPNNSAEYDFWDHLDFIISSAQDMGLYVTLLPAWGSRIAGDWGSGAPDANVILNIGNASSYASWISQRYENYTNIIWMIGGDRSAVYPPSYDYRPQFRAMAAGVLAGNANRPLLMSFHPRKWKPNSSEWFHNDTWLSFNSTQDQPSDQINATRYDYNLPPTKPTWLFEGGYEERHTASGDYVDWQVRFQAYQTVFAGGFGYTYGHMSIWEFKSDWKTKMQSFGANDMRHLYTLMTSMTNTQYFNLIPYQSLIDGDTGSMSGSEGIFSTCILAIRTSSKDLAMIYSANGRNIRVKMSLLASPTMTARWFDPRSGTWSDAGSDIPSGSGAAIVEFNPPGSTGNGNDYILVLGGEAAPPEPVEPYIDNLYNRGLLHCDAVVTNLWPDGSANCFVTPDDNSSGRPAIAPILNTSNNWDIGIDNSTLPTFKTNSPYGGDYLEFDGSDTIRITNAWFGGDNLDLDLSFRFNGLPALADNYAGMFWSYPVKAYLQNTGDDTYGKVMMLVYDAAGNPHFFSSTKVLNPNVWYHLSFSALNNNLQVVVGNDSDGYVTDTSSATGLLAPGDFNNVIIGSDFFGPTRLFQGDLDEIRWGVIIPEPCLFIIYYLSFIIYYLRKKN